MEDKLKKIIKIVGIIFFAMLAIILLFALIAPDNIYEDNSIILDIGGFFTFTFLIIMYSFAALCILYVVVIIVKFFRKRGYREKKLNFFKTLKSFCFNFILTFVLLILVNYFIKRKMGNMECFIDSILMAFGWEVMKTFQKKMID